MGCGWGTQGIDRRGSLGWRMCEVGGQGDWITLTRYAREHRRHRIADRREIRADLRRCRLAVPTATSAESQPIWLQRCGIERRATSLYDQLKQLDEGVLDGH